MKETKTLNLLILYDRSGQYNVPFLNEINKDKEIKVTAIFLETNHTSKIHYDPLYKNFIKWNHPANNFKVVYSKYQFHGNSSFRVFNGLDQLLNLNLILKNDVVIIHGYDKIIKIIIVIVCKLFKKKVLLRGETHLYDLKKKKLSKLFKFLYIKFLSFIFDGAIPIGTISKEFYKKYNWPNKKILNIVGATVDNVKDNYDKNLNIFEFRRDKFPKKNEKLKLLYIGRLHKRKGIDILIKSFKKLNTKKCELNIIGDGPLRELINEDELNIKYYGFVDNSELAKYFLMADFLICPSVFEPWGFVINEAYNFGLPVLASDKVACMVDINENDNQYIFKSQKEEDLILKINNLLNMNKSQYLKKVEKILRKINNWNDKSEANNLIRTLKSL